MQSIALEENPATDQFSATTIVAVLAEDLPPAPGAPATCAARLTAELDASLVAADASARDRHARAFGGLLVAAFGPGDAVLGRAQLALADGPPPGAAGRDERARRAHLLGGVAAGFHEAVHRREGGMSPKTGRLSGPKLRHLAAQVPSIVWTTDGSLCVTSAHSSAVFDGAFDFASLVGQRLDDISYLLDRQHRADLVPAHERALRGETVAFDLVVAGIPFKAHIDPLRADSGEIIGCVGTTIDDSSRQESLREIATNRARYETLIDSLDGVVWEHDLDAGRYTFVSARAETLLGYPREVWLETPGFWDQTIHPDDRARLQADLGSATMLKPTYQIEYRFRTADERWIWVRNFFSVIREPGQPLRTRGVLFDISRDHAVAEALRQSQEQFRAIFDNAGMGIALVSAEGQVSLANAAMHQMLGFAPGELHGTFLSTISHPDDRFPGEAHFIALMEGEGPDFQLEKRYLRRDGRVVWVNMAVSATTSPGDRGQAAIIIMKDITERKEFEGEFRHQLSLTRAITSSFRGGLCALDRDGRVTFINPAAEQILGWPDSTLLGKTLLARIHQPDPKVAASWRSATQQGQVLEVDDACFIRRDGTTFPVGYTLSPLIEEGVVRGAILGFRDITERKRLQGELIAVNRLLAESREQAQQHLARELHDGALQLLIGISYQLGRRLADQHDDELRGVRLAVLEVVAQLRALLGELRPAGLEELGLTTALEGYVARLQREAGPSAPAIALDLDMAGLDLPLPIARCLFRVAQEGLRNAVHHAQARRIELRLRLDEKEALLTLGDDGRGFAVPSSLSALTQSNHFGLVGMAERVALAGGQLSLKSQIGEGTVVHLSLPLDPSGDTIGQSHVELTSTLLLHPAMSRR